MHVIRVIGGKVISFKNWFLAASLLKKIGVGIAAAVVIFAGVHTFSPSATPKYQTAQADKGSVISTVTESGNVTGQSQTTITSPTNGIVEELYVSNGSAVNVGDQLFKVKSSQTPQDKAAAYASYLQAKATFDAANANAYSLRSKKDTAWQKFYNLAISATFQNPDGSPRDDIRNSSADFQSAQGDWLAAEQNYKNQQDVISQAQAALNSSSLSYQAASDAVVTAPVSGTVANLAVGIGSNVMAAANSTSTTTTSSTPALVIGNFSSLSVKVQVSEVDISRVKAGQKATITLDAFSDKTFVGSVSNVDLVGTSNSGVVTYTAYINFLYAPPGVQPGMTASVTIQTDRHDDVVKVPTNAVQTNNGSSYVRVLKKDGSTTQTTVETGLSSDTETEISSGLSGGETVVTGTVAARAGSTTSPFSAFGGGRGFGGGGGGGGNRGAAVGR